MDKKNYIVTIDGPVGSGKSTVGRQLAARLGLIYLDTGAMYRSVALDARNNHVGAEDENGLRELCSQIKITFEQRQNVQGVLLNGKDVTDDIRSPEISMLASRISAVENVRSAMLVLQREAGKNGEIVVDGRDAGTVIFPEAGFKFYLDATIEERAERRYKELVDKKIKVVYTELFNEIKKRDLDDSSRKTAPLKPADDAFIINTSRMTIEDVLCTIISKVEQGQSLLL